MQARWWIAAVVGGSAGLAACYGNPADFCAPGTPERNWAGVCEPSDAAVGEAHVDVRGEVDAGRSGEDGTVADASGDASFVERDAPASCAASQSPHDDPCVLQDGYGVFVAPAASGGSDATGAGTRAAPYATLGYALAHLSGSARVYICAGAAPYAEPVSIGQPVSLFGGLSCAGGAWSYSGTAAPIASPTTDYGLKVDGVSGEVVLEDLAVTSPGATGQDANRNGMSSLAALVNASSHVTLRRCTLTAGTGANGGDAKPGTNYSDGPTAPSGNANSGATGGAGGVANCVSGSSAGGKGGDGVAGSTGGGDGGANPMPVVGNGFDGIGGGGSTSCVPGDPGANGAPGDAGTAPPSAGTLAASGWTPASGSAGGNGGPGQGGGGGGGKSTAHVGGSGGGAGGCGGAAGMGGGGGGASIALACVNSSVTLVNCVMKTAAGGVGGKGADGQAGQAGGGSPNGAGSCFGGYGGNGSGGSGGAGGNGGPSACVAQKGITAPSGSWTCTNGAGGLGGAGGKGATGGDNMQGNPGAAGADGADGGVGPMQNLVEVP